MPFCTACGKQNPDDARFCSQCGTALAPPTGDPPSAAGRRRVDRDDHHRRSAREGRHLRPAAQPGRRGRRRRTARGQRHARRAAGPERRQPVPARHGRGHRRPPPRQRDLPRRRHRLAPARGVPPRGRRASRVTDVGSLNGTYVNRDRIDKVLLKDGDEVQIGKYRLVFFSGHATPSRLTSVQPRRRRVALGRRMNIGQVLDQLRPDFPGVTIPKIRFLEDKGLIKPERTPVRLPQVLRTTTSSGCATSCACSATTTCRSR